MSNKNSSKKVVSPVVSQSGFSRSVLAAIAVGAENREHYLGAVVAAIGAHPEADGVDQGFGADSKNGRAIMRRVLGGVRKSDGVTYDAKPISPSWLNTAHKIATAHVGKVTPEALTAALARVSELHNVSLKHVVTVFDGAPEPTVALMARHTDSPPAVERAGSKTVTISVNATPPPVVGVDFQALVEAEVQKRLAALFAKAGLSQ